MDNRKDMKSFLAKAAAISKRVDEIAPKKPSTAQPTMAESVRAEGMMDSYSGYEQQPSYDNYEQPNYQGGGYTKAAGNLPQGIFEALTTNPIQDHNGPMNGLSVLDSIMPPPQQRQQRQPQQQLNEEYYPDEKPMPNAEERFRQRRETGNQQPTYQQPVYQPTYQQPVYQQPATSGIDYSIIKLMIEDVISKEFTRMRKTIISESRASVGDKEVIMTVGDSIKFISKNGNIFEGKVSKVGNVNEL